VANAKDLSARVVYTLHDAVIRVSGGRLLGNFGGMPVLKLTTTGRKSGQPRSTMLTAPVHEGDRLVVVASYGGDDRHPAWFLNLQANPRVEVTIGGKTQPMQARVATADEKAELWPKVVAAYKGYAGYQTKTSRDIPLVILEP
jgi:deazaflavin-dependent oxidoreductase (nitroreductase family)